MVKKKQPQNTSSKPKILVTGGAGYIGSFTVNALKDAGYEPIVFDNFESGHPEAITGTKIYVGDLRKDNILLGKILKKEKPEAVIHFASYISVGQSTKDPEVYFRNNVVGTLNLLNEMVKNKIDKFVFSSSAAVYGEPEKTPIKEEDRKEPVNPYGETKLMVEKILKWFDKAYKLRSISLRYFNAAGASLDGDFGEDHPNESHLIPLAIKAAMDNREFSIFGNDYETKDGTCVRDYIHVLDLAQAHILSLKSLERDFPTSYFNAATGCGYSNLQIINEIKKISGIDFPIKFDKRRVGDPANLYADNKKIKIKLDFHPEYSDLKTIIKSAWLWHKKHPNGYRK